MRKKYRILKNYMGTGGITASGTWAELREASVLEEIDALGATSSRRGTYVEIARALRWLLGWSSSLHCTRTTFFPPRHSWCVGAPLLRSPPHFLFLRASPHMDARAMRCLRLAIMGVT